MVLAFVNWLRIGRYLEFLCDAYILKLSLIHVIKVIYVHMYLAGGFGGFGVWIIGQKFAKFLILKF